LVREIVSFFKTGKPPVPPEESIAIYAFMEAADESRRRNGKEVPLAEVLKKVGKKRSGQFLSTIPWFERGP
jgi:hypothetical protein